MIQTSLVNKPQAGQSEAIMHSCMHYNTPYTALHLIDVLTIIYGLQYLL